MALSYHKFVTNFGQLLSVKTKMGSGAPAPLLSVFSVDMVAFHNNLCILAHEGAGHDPSRGPRLGSPTLNYW